MIERRREPYPGYIIRWDDNAAEELHYVNLAEGRELVRAIRAAGIGR